MTRSGIDADALIAQFSQASAKQSEALREAVHEVALKALQGRELTLKSIKEVLKRVTQAVSAGAANSALEGDDVERLLSSAVQGMDAAVLQAVEANRRALEQLVAQGADLRQKPLQKALADMEKMEEALFAGIDKAAAGALEAPWAQALQAFRDGGSATGGAASKAVESLRSQARDAVREGHAFGQRATQALLEHYAALASGVLIGMSGAMAPAVPAARPRGKG